MQYTTLGNSGLQVSRICLGMMTYGDPHWRDWILGEEDARPLVHRAYELGINFFDTADMYSLGESEIVTGKVLAELAPRDQLVIASKVYFPMSDDPNDRGLSRKHIIASCENSLRRLNTDYLDLYYIHRWNYATPIEETLEALSDLIRDGKVRYIGASSMYAFQFAKALCTADAYGWSRFVAMQNHYNLLYREEEREMIPLCNDQGVGIVPWSPLARGYLAGGRFPDEAKPTARAMSDSYAAKMYNLHSDREVVQAVHDIATQTGWSEDPRAEKAGWSPSQIALAWMLGKEGVVAPVIGSTRLTHIEEAVAAVDFLLDEDTVDTLETPYAPHPVLGHPPIGVEHYDAR
jgi:1-deoxyxylulose-5-phosphate synthase